MKNDTLSEGCKHRFCTPLWCTKSLYGEIPTPFIKSLSLTKRRKMCCILNHIISNATENINNF